MTQGIMGYLSLLSKARKNEHIGSTKLLKIKIKYNYYTQLHHNDVMEGHSEAQRKHEHIDERTKEFVEY